MNSRARLQQQLLPLLVRWDLHNQTGQLTVFKQMGSIRRRHTEDLLFHPTDSEDRGDLAREAQEEQEAVVTQEEDRMRQELQGQDRRQDRHQQGEAFLFGTITPAPHPGTHPSGKSVPKSIRISLTTRSIMS